MREVDIDTFPLTRFVELLDEDRRGRFLAAAESAHRMLAGRTVWNVNSAATGGGVAEMMQVLVGQARGAGVNTRWLVIDGTPQFFLVTKRLHNWFHGAPGDGGDLGGAEHAIYEQTLAANEAEMAARVRPGDAVLLHDPQTAGLVAAAKRAGAIVVWRSHIGRDEEDELSRLAWEFLWDYLEEADALVFSRAQYAPSFLDRDRLHVIAPSIDPLSAKNQDLSPQAVQAILARIGLLAAGKVTTSPAFERADGTPGLVADLADVVAEGPPLDPAAPLVVQVSRWDRLKDMFGVMMGFAEHVEDPDANLALVGPEVSGVADDPEAKDVLEECIAAWRRLPARRRRRIRLVSLPMRAVDANAAMVNAIQSHATVVVQKSLIEGFGLTVAEAMWKTRPVIATSVGGIIDQIVDGEHGLLLNDPTDLLVFGSAGTMLLRDPREQHRLGRNAQQRVKDRFLGDRHLIEWAQLLGRLVVS